MLTFEVPREKLCALPCLQLVMRRPGVSLRRGKGRVSGFLRQRHSKRDALHFQGLGLSAGHPNCGPFRLFWAIRVQEFAILGLILLFKGVAVSEARYDKRTGAIEGQTFAEAEARQNSGNLRSEERSI